MLDTLREDFSLLYNNTRQEIYFYAQSLGHKLLLRQSMEEPDHQENEYLNKPLSYIEANINFFLDDNSIETVDRYKYLSVTLKGNLDFSSSAVV